MYKLLPKTWDNKNVNVVLRTTDNTFIPFNSSNTDYRTFRKDLTEGEELQDAEGNVMTAEEVEEFVATLP
jgi:hypothetical protein